MYQLRPTSGSVQSRKRVGRGNASGTGKTCGRGMKGQRSRSGKRQPYTGFEGGQTPLYRRLPKRGFFPVTGLFRRKMRTTFSVGDLDRLQISGEVTREDLIKSKLMTLRKNVSIRLIGSGEITRPIQITVAYASPSAQKKIEKAGGKIFFNSFSGKGKK